MAHWEEIQVKAKMLVEEALKVLKSGATEAEFLAGTTASAAKLHIGAKKALLDKYKLLHGLGELVYEKASSSAESASMGITQRMKDIIRQIQSIDDEIARTEKRLSKFSVVKKQEKQGSDSETKRTTPRRPNP